MMRLRQVWISLTQAERPRRERWLQVWLDMEGASDCGIGLDDHGNNKNAQA
jgi:hypothetical protein